MKLLRKIKYKLKYYISPIPQPEKWVFIAGCSNSGTTLLHAILSAHPLIGTLPDEGQFCTNQLPLARNTGPDRLWALPPKKLYLDEKGDPRIDVRKVKKQWASKYNDVKRPVLLEKSPPNTVRLRWLQENFPNAYFIGIHRNGYTVAEGIRRKAGHMVDLGARQWANANHILLEDLQKMQRKMLISYESLTEDTEESIQKICQFIGIPMLDKEALVHSFSIHGKARKINNMNHLFLKNLSKEDFLLVEKEAGVMLQRLNYFRNIHTLNTSL